MDDLLEILVRVSQFSIVLPLLLGLFLYPRLGVEQRRLLLLVAVYTFFELAADKDIGWIEWLIGKKDNNLPGLHLFTIVQYVLILNIYGNFLQKIIPRWVYWAGFVLFPIWGIINGIWFDGWYNYNPNARSVQIIVILVLVLLYFYQLLKTIELKRLESDPLFWVSCGLLIYFSGSLFIFLMSNYFLDNKNYELLESIWGMHSILNVIANLSFAIALWINSRKPISP